MVNLCKWKAGAYYIRPICVDKESETLIMQLQMRNAYNSRCKQTTGEALSEGEIGLQEIKMLSIARFIWQNNWYSICVAIRYQNKIYILCNETF